MKKIVSLIGVIAILLTMSVSVFAGDIPEALGVEEDAQIFIGTLKDFELYNSTGSQTQNVSVVPTVKIKGEVKINQIQTYEMCYFGKVTPEKDTEYLFGWLADNSVWAYAIESYNENEIKLKITDDFAERIQSSLDNGIYEKLEIERMSGSRPPSQSDASSTSVIGGADEPTDIVVKSNVNVWLIVGVGALVLALIVFLVVRKKR